MRSTPQAPIHPASMVLKSLTTEQLTISRLVLETSSSDLHFPVISLSQLACSQVPIIYEAGALLVNFPIEKQRQSYREAELRLGIVLCHAVLPFKSSAAPLADNLGICKAAGVLQEAGNFVAT